MRDLHALALQEAAQQHNQVQSYRRLCADDWVHILALLDNRDAARLATGCRFLNALVCTLFAPSLAFVAADKALLRDLTRVDLPRALIINSALNEFQMLACVVCRDHLPSTLLELPECQHLVCDACWSYDSEMEETWSQTTTGCSRWANCSLKCNACGVNNPMGTRQRGDLSELPELRTVYTHEEDDGFIGLHNALCAEVEDPLCDRVRRKIAAHNRLFEYLFDRHASPQYAAICRELSIDARWFRQATRRLGSTAATHRRIKFSWMQ